MYTIRTNILRTALTQYTNFDFNSMMMFNGVMLGASDVGLYKLNCGNDDNGVNIDAYFIPITTDFGINNPKRLRFIYFGYESDGDIKIGVTPDEKDEKDYDIESTKIGQQRRRIPITRDQVGRYWKFKISNVDGSDFSVDSISLIGMILNNGLR